MRILLDTHTFLYWSFEPDRLPKNLLILLSNPSNQIMLSVVSSWEAQILYSNCKIYKLICSTKRK